MSTLAERVEALKEADTAVEDVRPEVEIRPVLDAVSARAKLDVIPLGGTVREAVQAALRYALLHFAGKTVRNKSDGSQILVSRQGIKHALSHGSGLLDAMAATDLLNLLANAKHVTTVPDRKGRRDIVAVHFYAGQVDFGETVGEVGIVVREHRDGRRYYDHFALKAKPPAGARGSGVSLDSASGAATSTASEALGHQPMSSDKPSVTGGTEGVNAVLDTVGPLERLKITGQLGGAVKALADASSPIERIRLSRQVAELLAKLREGKLSFSLQNKEASARSLRAYLDRGLADVGPALAHFEALTVSELAAEVGDHDLVAEARARYLKGHGGDPEASHLAALEAISARGVDPKIDRDQVNKRLGEMRDTLNVRADQTPEYKAILAEAGALNEEARDRQRQVNALLRSRSPDADAAVAGWNAWYADYQRRFKDINKRLAAFIDDFNARKAQAEADALGEAGKAVIASVLAASPVSEEEATSWAKAQVIDDKAAAKLRRLKYPKEQVIRDMAEFYRLTGGKASAVRISVAGGRRASAENVTTRRDEKIINLGSHFNKTVLFHELAHHLENDPIAKAAANGFLVKRRESKTVYRLSQLTGQRGYGPREVAYKDEFLSPYIGKVYPDGVTEVFSMGVQYLSNPKDAAMLAAQDPEMFALISGYLASPLTPAMNAKLHMHEGVIGELQEKRQTEAVLFEKATSALAARITLEQDGWWDALREEDDTLRRRIEYYLFTRGKPAKYIGAHGGYRVFEGVFRNPATRRRAKGHLVVGASVSFSSLPDHAFIHGGLDMTKAAIALSAEQGLSLGSIYRAYLTPDRRGHVNPRLIEAARSVVGEAL